MTKSHPADKTIHTLRYLAEQARANAHYYGHWPESKARAQAEREMARNWDEQADELERKIREASGEL